MLVTSIFSFSQNLLFPNQISIFQPFNFSSANAFSLDMPKILSFVKELIDPGLYGWRFLIPLNYSWSILIGNISISWENLSSFL